MEISDEEHDSALSHYGILRKSGRYPWGSGKTPEERSKDFLGRVQDMRDQGLSEVEIAKGLNMKTTELRQANSIAKNAKQQADVGMAQRLKDAGWSNVAIGKRMGIGESSVRGLLAPGALDKSNVINTTADILRTAVDEKGYIDIGSGVEQHMSITTTKLGDAVAKLKDEGYTIHYIPVEQLGTGNKTTVKVLASPDTPYGEVYRNRDNIQQVMAYSDSGGRGYDKVLPPLSVDQSRLSIRYAEQGGTAADGVVFIRPAVKDLSLGGANYAQVRVSIDGTHFIKGMAVYKDDLPEGVDLEFNTNKSDTGNKLDALKPYKKDPDMPFGSIVRQIQEVGPNGEKRVASAMNIVNEEGDWEDWSKTLSSQMLSKQSPSLAQAQLDLAYQRSKDEFDGINKVDNEAVRQKLLDGYAESADSAAVHLKAAALPRTENHVILPIASMKPTEVYAPKFRDGEQVVLIRHPHGGKFEIPQLTVNNKNAEARKLLGEADDAIGIHSSVAQKLSGADFDGDTVLVIPNNKGLIKTEPSLEALKGFDPQHEYPAYDGMPKMSAKTKGVEMGMVSNLITDMTLKGATNAELARAVRHSMVVIDAEKHNLNYRQSAIDNGIAHLKSKYQGSKTGGASTLISQASATVRVPVRKARSAKDGGPVDRATGKKQYTYTKETYEKDGVTVDRTFESKRLAETDDAHTLSSGSPIESIYADYSNKMKALGDAARKESIAIKPITWSPEAKTKYKPQVESLEAKLNLALRNSPLERQAQIFANAIVAQKKQANPDLEKSDLKKIKAQALTEARNRTGARKNRIEITPDEWEAIQAGAISNNRLHQILNNADLDVVKQLATPKEHKLMSDTKKSQALAMLGNGYTQAQVADQLGVSVSTLKRSLSQGDA